MTANPYDAVIADLRTRRYQIDKTIQDLEKLRFGALVDPTTPVPPPSGSPGWPVQTVVPLSELPTAGDVRGILRDENHGS